MNDVTSENGSGNVFADLGFSPAEAAELAVKSALIREIGEIIQDRKLTQQAIDAAGGGKALPNGSTYVVEGVARSHGKRDDRSSHIVAHGPWPLGENRCPPL